MGSTLSSFSPTSSLSDSKWKSATTSSSLDIMSDEEAIALLENALARDVPSLGPLNEYGQGAPVWRITPDIIAKLVESSPAEAYMMGLASSQTSIPVPKVLKSITFRGRRCVLMEYVEGSDLYKLWPSLGLWRRFRVAWILRKYVRQLRTVKLPNKGIPGPFDATGVALPCHGHHFSHRGVGPFESYAAMTKWYNDRCRLSYILANMSIPEQISSFDDSMPLVFTHGDLSMSNIRVGEDGRIWILDWERAGAYPRWFECANMMAYAPLSKIGQIYDDVFWPRGWKWLVPLIAGWYEKELSFLQESASGIKCYGFEGFD